MDTIFVLACIFCCVSALSALFSSIFCAVQQTLDDLDQYNFIKVLIRKYLHV